MNDVLTAAGAPEAATTIEVLHDVLAVPGSHCLYDREGRRIDRSMTWLGLRPRGPKPDRAPDDANATVVDQPAVYGGLLPKPHFGHVLLETFSRLWFLGSDRVDPHAPIVFHAHRNRSLEQFERRLLDAALAGASTTLRPIDRPMRFRELHLPTQAVVLGRPFDPAILAVYDRIRERIVGDVEPDDRPLHLSRARVATPRRRTLGEAALDARLRERGFRVLHPQEHPLEDQIRAIAAARTVTGLNGSALHLTILRSLPGATTVSIDPRTPFAIQRDVDHVRGARFVSLHAQYPLQPRSPGGRTAEIGRYRSFVLPRWTARRLAATVES